MVDDLLSVCGPVNFSVTLGSVLKPILRIPLIFLGLVVGSFTTTSITTTTSTTTTSSSSF